MERAESTCSLGNWKTAQSDNEAMAGGGKIRP
jgi:hypothetical protein